MSPDSYLVGLIGSGIGPSLSPALHEREADRQGLRYLYRLIDIGTLGVPPERTGELVRAARDMGYDGLNVTHPCKQQVLDHLDALSPQAEALGAVNTVVFEGAGRRATTPTPRASPPPSPEGCPTRHWTGWCSWAPAARERPSPTPCSPWAPAGSPCWTPFPSGLPPSPAP